MEASFLCPSPSFSSYRTSKDAPHMQSVCVQKVMTCFPIHNQDHKRGQKLYIIPIRRISRFCVLTSSVGSLDVGETSHGNHVSTGFSSSRNYQSMSELERQLQELFDEIKSMIRMGNKNDAIELLKANYEVVLEQLSAGAKGIEEAAILDVIALGYMAVGDLKFVGSLLNLMSEVVNNLEDDVPHLDSVLMHMGSMYSTLGNFEKSLNVYQRAIGIMEKTYGKDNAFLVTPCLGMAKVLGTIGKATKAIEVYQRAISVLESSRGAESKDLVVPLLSLGNLLLKEGKAIDAETHFIRVLNIYKKFYGQNDGRVGMAMSSLAHAKCAQGNVEEAIHLYKSALQIIKDSNYMSVDDSIMEKMRVDLAELLHAVGRGQEGRELLEECLLITERYKGEGHPSLVTHMVNLATSYSHSKSYVEAECLLRKSLEILIKNMGSEDQSISFPMLQLAVTLFQLKQDEEAEQLALEALRLREKAFGENSLPVDFRMPPNASGHPSLVTEKLESDSVPSNPVSVNSGCMPHSPNMKWWLHVKTNMGNEPNSTCKHLNSWEAELGAFCGEFVDDNAKIGGDQSVRSFDPFSCIGSADSVGDQSWRISPTFMSNVTDTEMPKLEAALNYQLQKTYKKKDEGEFLFSDDHLMEWDTENFLTSEPCKSTSSDLESHLIGTEKAGPWWRTAGKEDLPSFVAQKSLEHIQNFDLPKPQVTHFRKSPSVPPKCIDHDKALPSSANPIADMSTFNADSYTYGTTPTSGCSFQDLGTTFSSRQSKDSGPITKDGRINSKSNATSELLEALCHSQTRAREAEKAAQQAYNEKEHILGLFFKQASQLFAYKQWLQLLQLENLCLQLRNKNQPLLNLLPATHRGKQPNKNHCRAAKRKKKNIKLRHGLRKCAVAFAVGVGLAGAGLLLGWTMGLMFPIYRNSLSIGI